MHFNVDKLKREDKAKDAQSFMLEMLSQNGLTPEAFMLFFSVIRPQRVSVVGMVNSVI